MQGSCVIRDDGIRGEIIANAERGQVVVDFGDGARVVVSPQTLILQGDGSYRLVSAPSQDEIVIPVVAEELTVETMQVARGKVRVHKRVETRQELVDAAVTREDVLVEHVPVNKFIEDATPEVREEDGVLIIPMIEEVLVVEKRLLLREGVRVSKRRTTTSTPQTVDLRREIIDIEREDFNGTDLPKEVAGKNAAVSGSPRRDPE